MVRQPMPGVVYASSSDITRYVRAGALGNETLAAAFSASFEKHAAQPAIAGPDGRMTYGELDERTDRLAAALLGLGLQPLDRALFQMANSPELLIATVACLKAGIIPVCTLAAHREQEIGQLGRHAEARVWFVQGDDEKFDLPGFAERLRPAIPSMAHVIVARGAPRAGQLSMEGLIEKDSTPKAGVQAVTESLDPFQAAVFQLSGGTTGVSKIIPRFSNDYLGSMHAVIESARRRAPEVVFSAGPLLHNAGFVCHWGPGLLLGSTIVISRDFTEDGLLDLFLQHRPTWVFLPKPLLVRLIAARKRRGGDLSSVRSCTTLGAGPIIRRELGTRPTNTFGMAEGPIMMTRPDDPDEALADTVGRPLSPLDEVRLVRPDTLEEVGAGEMGELLWRGPYTLRGYYRADERNRESFTRDGFLRTGDLMRRRDVGYVFEGRLKDIVKRAGESISCDEIERVLRDLPGIADVAVVPVPDEVYLEKACACLVLQPGAAAPTVAGLGQILAGAGLAKFKWPEHVQIYDAFPTTTSGKLSKPLLREQAAARLRGAAHETARRAPHGPAHLEAEGDGRVLPRQAGP
jgi:non-ribosomal peptide synthetase component E (peptide arylation enzyme)